MPKLAVACLLVRLLNPPISHKIFLYALTTSCILTQALCAIFLWVQCKPAAGLWNPTLNPVCWNENILIDFSIFAGCEFRVRAWEGTLTDYGSVFCIHRFVPRALSGHGAFQAATESEEEGWPELRAWPWGNVRKDSLRLGEQPAN